MNTRNSIRQHALIDSLPETHPYAHERHDDFTYDPVIVKVYRWLQGMEEALDRRYPREEEPYQA